jgi:hypothetical protein
MINPAATTSLLVAILIQGQGHMITSLRPPATRPPQINLICFPPHSLSRTMQCMNNAMSLVLKKKKQQTIDIINSLQNAFIRLHTHTRVERLTK